MSETKKPSCWKRCCPVPDDISAGFVGFIFMIIAMLIFPILFIIAVIIYFIHLPAGFVLVIFLAWVMTYLFVWVLVNLNSGDIFDEETLHKATSGRKFGKSSTGLRDPIGCIRCAHSVSIFGVIVMFFIIAYILYFGINLGFLIEEFDTINSTANVTMNDIVKESVWGSLFILLLISMCTFALCRWSYNNMEFHRENDKLIND